MINWHNRKSSYYSIIQQSVYLWPVYVAVCSCCACVFSEHVHLCIHINNGLLRKPICQRSCLKSMETVLYCLGTRGKIELFYIRRTEWTLHRVWPHRVWLRGTHAWCAWCNLSWCILNENGPNPCPNQDCKDCMQSEGGVTHGTHTRTKQDNDTQKNISNDIVQKQNISLVPKIHVISPCDFATPSSPSPCSSCPWPPWTTVPLGAVPPVWPTAGSWSWGCPSPAPLSSDSALSASAHPAQTRSAITPGMRIVNW